MESLIFYIISFLICVVILHLVYKNENKLGKGIKIVLIIIALFIPITISGIRYGVGTDFFSYYNSILHMENLNLAQYLQSDYEIGFIIISKIALLFNTEQVLFIIFAILTVVFAFLGILNKKDKISVALGTFIYLFMFFTSSFNGMRQCLAVVIMFFAYKYIIKKDFLKFILFTLLAMCFHKTAIVLLPFYFILNLGKENKWLKISGILVTTILALNIENVLYMLGNINIFEKYTVYVNGDMGGVGHMIFNILILIIITVYIKRLIKYDKDSSVYYYLYLVGVILSTLSLNVVALGRISSYFTISLVYLLPLIPKVINDKKEKTCISILMVVCVLVWFILNVYVFGISEVIPYKTFLGR